MSAKVLWQRKEKICQRRKQRKDLPFMRVKKHKNFGNNIDVVQNFSSTIKSCYKSGGGRLIPSFLGGRQKSLSTFVAKKRLITIYKSKHVDGGAEITSLPWTVISIACYLKVSRIRKSSPKKVLETEEQTFFE